MGVNLLAQRDERRQSRVRLRCRAPRAVAALLAISAAACLGPNLSELGVGVDARSAIFVELRPDEPPRARALELTDAPIYVGLDAPAGSELFALAYSRPLDALGPAPLSPGPIAFAAPGVAGTPLPQPERLYSARIEEDGAATFTRAADPALPDRLRQLAVVGPPRTPCVELTKRPIVVSTTVSAHFVVPDEERGAIVLLADNRLMLVDLESGRVEPLPRERSLGQWSGAWRARDGTLWVTTSGDRDLLHGTAAGGFERIAIGTSSAPEGLLTRVVGPARDDVPFELFAMSSTSELCRFAGGRWSRLATGPSHGSVDQMGVAWVAPGEAIAAGLREGKVLRWRESNGGQLTEETVAADPRLELMSAALHPTLGQLVGGDRGEVYRYDVANGVWDATRVLGGSIDLRFLVPIDGGFLTGGEGGVLAQFQPGASCAEQALGDNIRDVIAVGTGWLALIDDDPGAMLVWMRRAGG